MFLFVLIFLFGFFLRAQETLSNNFLFLLDQGRDMMAVKGILYDHHLTLIGPNTSLAGVFQGPFWYYLLFIPTFLTGGNPWGGIALMLLISLLVLAISFFWMRKFFGNPAAFLTMLLMSVSPEAISAARYTWNPHPMWLLLTIFVFSFYEIILGRKKFHLILWPVVSLMFHFEAALAIFILLASLIYLLIFNTKQYKSKYFYLGFVISLALFLPQLVFELRHNFIMTKSVIGVMSGKEGGLFIQKENTHNFLNLVSGHLYSFTVNFTSSFLQSGFMKNLPLLFLILLVFTIIFGKKLGMVSDKENKFLWMVTRLIIIALFLMLIYPFPIRYWFLTGFEVFYILPLGLVLSKIYSYKKAKPFLYILFLTILIYIIPNLYTLYARPDYGGVAKIRGKEDAIDYIYKDAKGKHFNLLVFTPPVYTYAYDYLIWWQGQKKYHYLPGSKKEGAFYLLIEPDPGQPWTYKGWLQNVIKTGKVISTKQLPSGLIVQKRIED